MSIKGTVWNYEYEEYDENGKPVKRTLRLVYNLKTLKTYYNFFGKDLMGDFARAAVNAKKRAQGLSKELREKLANDSLTDEDLSDESLITLMQGIVSDNNEFTINATVAMVAAGEENVRSAEEIEESLPVTITEETFRKKLIEFITFCAENAKKNKVQPFWVG